jgi:hypothetical protein
MLSSLDWRKNARGAIRVWLPHVLAALVLVPACLWAAAPSWWAERNVLKPGATADDYAVVNQGQVKHIAKQAYDEMKANGVVDAVAAEASTNPDDPSRILFLAWNNPAVGIDDYAAVNIGQLKNVAKPFYDRLALTYPWSTSTIPSDDFALANIGQVKNLFSFSILGGILDPEDTDGNGLPDSWELEHFGMIGISPTADSDGDGISNLAEFLAGTDPLSPSNSSVHLNLFAPFIR